MAQILIPKETALARALGGLGAPGEKPNKPVVVSSPGLVMAYSLYDGQPFSQSAADEFTYCRDAVTNYFALGHPGGSGYPSGMYWQIKDGVPCIYTNDTGTGEQASKRLRIGNLSQLAPRLGNSFTYIIKVWRSDTSNLWPLGFVSEPNLDHPMIRDKSGKINFLIPGEVEIGTSTTVMPTQQWVQIAVTYDGSTVRFYQDGVADGSATNTQTLDWDSEFETTQLRNGSYWEWQYLFNRVLSQAEIQAIKRDPSLVYEPANQSPILIGTAGVVATEIDATTDALTITEYNCTVEAGVATEIDATLDTLTLTEYNTTVSADTSVSATADSLTITEYAATISAGTNLSATSEALTLTEYNTTVSFNVNVSTTADTLTIIDYPVSLGTNVNASVDALTITSYNASISLDVGVSATSEALTITDYNATVATGANVAATLDTLTITDYNVSVGYDTNVTATADSLTITEYNATVQANVDTDITATLEALTLTEFNTNVAFGTGISATVDALTLTEYNATIGAVVNTNISAGVEALTLTEYNSSVSAPGTTTLTAQDIANIEAAFKDAVRSVLFVDNNT